MDTWVSERDLEKWASALHSFLSVLSIRAEPGGEGKAAHWQVRSCLFQRISPRVALPAFSMRPQVPDLWRCQWLDIVSLRNQRCLGTGSWGGSPSLRHFLDSLFSHGSAWSREGPGQWVFPHRRPCEMSRVRTPVSWLFVSPLTSWMIRLLSEATLLSVFHMVVWASHEI